MTPKAIASHLGNFLLPIVVMLAACAVVGIYPFGPMSFIIDDGQFQYVDFYAWYHQVLLGEANPFYVSAQALGTNAWGQNSYYLASPFNVLVLLFGEDHLSEFALVTCALKMGCVQLATTFFLRRRFQLKGPWATVLALGFTMSMWTITQMRNPMWMDGLIFLPLAAWGVCCLIRRGQWRLFVLALAGAIITCWYMGYMIVLFLVLYWFFEEYVLTAVEGVAPAGTVQRRRFVLFLAAMLLALALSAFMFAPTVCAMLDAGSASSGGSESLVLLEETLQNRLPDGISADSIIVAALIAAVVLAVGVAVLFACVRRYSTRRKAAVLLLVLLMLCLLGCLAVPQLQHGSLLDVLAGLFVGWWVDSKTPQLYGNVVVLLGAIAFFALRRVPLKLKLAAGLFLLLLVESSWLRPWEFIWGGFRIPYGYHSRMSFVAIFMLMWLAAFAARAIRSNVQQSGRGWLSGLTRFLEKPWVAHAALVLVTIEAIVRTCLVWGGFYIHAHQADYDAYMQSAAQQMAELEQADPGVYRVEKTYSRMDMPAYNEAMALGYNTLASYSSTTDASTLAFLSALGYGDNSFYTYDLEPTLLGESLLGVKYVSAFQAPFGFEDAGLTPASNGARFYRNPSALALAYCVSDDALGLTLETVQQCPDRYQALNRFANALAGEEVNPYELSTLNMPAFQTMIDTLAAHQMTFDQFEDGSIAGTFTAPEDSVLLMTIPNQSGWQVELNGQPATPLDIADGALMGIPAEPGENRLVMRFVPPGLYAGCVTSALTAVFLVVISVRKRRQIARKTCALDNE